MKIFEFTPEGAAYILKDGDSTYYDVLERHHIDPYVNDNYKSTYLVERETKIG